MSARVQLVVRDGCHLCIDALAILEEVAGRHNIAWETLNIDSDRNKLGQYSDHVPVLLVDSSVVSRWFVDADQLDIYLRALKSGSG